MNLIQTKCKYCDADNHTIKSCQHLTVDHDADSCQICTSKRRRKQTKNKSTSLFSNQTYWNNRYEKTTVTAGTGRNEWFVDFNMLHDILIKTLTTSNTLPPIQNALEIGCGMSVLSEELLTHQFVNLITAIDFSSPAILHMLERQSNNVDVIEALQGKAVNYLEMDATKMSFDEKTFDLIIEKGTLDALLTDESQNDTGSSSEIGNIHARMLLKETERVLSKNGIFIIVSHSESRDQIVNECGFSIDDRCCIENGNAKYHVFVCTKKK